ncbi:MAG: type IX secretion system membrane protein PorP/SprF, partial [Flavobacteriales bacterium]|nr:type IX secretion system membrane protein PorP/SprF [Flavobacteriales bacterium]
MKRILLSLFITLQIISYGQQDPTLIINEHNQEFINPAEAGANGKFDATLFGQQRWMSLSMSYATYGVQTSHFLEKLNSGIGVRYFHDVHGISKTDNLTASYNYQIKLRTGSLNFGTRLGWQRFRTELNWNGFNPGPNVSGDVF